MSSSAQPKQLVENAGHYEGGDPSEGQMVEVRDLSILTSAEIDMQITTAKKYPRSLTAFRRQAIELATSDFEFAQACIYAIPRDGKIIEGPSARFAEVMATCWGNNRTGARVVGIDAEHVTAQGFFFDLEKNTAITFEVKRRITDKYNKRYNADMIMTTGNAACSIAHRNAVLKGVPQAIWSDIFDKSKEVVKGSAETFGTRLAKAMKALNVCGVTNEQIYNVLQVKGFDDLSTDHLIKLGGLYTAIKEGDLSVEDAFGPSLKPGEVAPPRPVRSDFERTGNTVKQNGPGEPEVAGGKQGLADAERKARITALGEAAIAEEEAAKKRAAAATQPQTVSAGAEISASRQDGEDMLTFCEEMISKNEEGTQSQADLDELKTRQIINIDNLPGLTPEDRSALVGRLNSIILTGKTNLKKKQRGSAPAKGKP